MIRLESIRFSGRARVALAAIGVASLGLAVGTRGYDDAFITYVYARTFAQGGGLTWEGVRVLGTTSPLLAVGLAGAELMLPLGIPAWGGLVGWTSIFAMTAALLALGHSEDWSGGSALAAAVLATAPLLHDYVGGEYLPAIAGALIAAAAWSRGREVVAAILLGIAISLRSETALAAPLLALAAKTGPARSSLRAIARVAILAAITLTTWLLVLWWLAGTVLPSSLAAKRAQGESVLFLWPSGERLLSTLIRDLPAALVRETGMLAIAALLALACLGLLAWARPGWRRRPFTGALIVWGPVHCLALAVLGVGAYAWYATPLVVSFAILIGWAWELPGAWRPGLRRCFRIAVIGALVLVQLPGAAWGRSLFHRRGDPKRTAYARVARLADLYPAGTRLAAYETGYLGYEARNPVVDLLGLVTPGVSLARVRSGDLAAIREDLDPDLLMLPLDGGSLVSSTVGDVESFLAKFRLDRLLLDTRPMIAVYRRATLAGHGSVLRDLAAEAASESGSRTAIRFVERRNGSSLAAVVAPGSPFVFDLEAGERARFLGGFSGPRGAAVTLDSTTGGRRTRIAGIRSDGVPRWIGWSAELDCESGPCRYEIGCLAPEPKACFLAFPHLAVQPGG